MQTSSALESSQSVGGSGYRHPWLDPTPCGEGSSLGREVLCIDHGSRAFCMVSDLQLVFRLSKAGLSRSRTSRFGSRVRTESACPSNLQGLRKITPQKLVPGEVLASPLVRLGDTFVFLANSVHPESRQSPQIRQIPLISRTSPKNNKKLVPSEVSLVTTYMIFGNLVNFVLHCLE